MLEKKVIKGIKVSMMASRTINRSVRIEAVLYSRTDRASRMSIAFFPFLSSLG